MCASPSPRNTGPESRLQQPTRRSLHPGTTGYVTKMSIGILFFGRSITLPTRFAEIGWSLQSETKVFEMSRKKGPLGFRHKAIDDTRDKVIPNKAPARGHKPILELLQLEGSAHPESSSPPIFERFLLGTYRHSCNVLHLSELILFASCQYVRLVFSDSYFRLEHASQ